jgi:hypothetical protein
LVDVTILGGGAIAVACGDVLLRAGFSLRRGFELESSDRSPIILGEIPSAFTIARQVVESGRHLLIASPANLSPERLSLLLDNRKRAQALFVWSERRYHPAYRFMNSLIEADSTWQPRFLRQETLAVALPTSALARWLTLEAVALVLGLAREPGTSVMATCALNATRNAPDLISLALTCATLDAYIQVGLGEAVERRETLLASADRKAYIDELNQSTPIRLIEDDRAARGGSSRWLACPSSTPDELARQQCLAFLHATLESQQALDEADLLLRSLSVFSAAEASFKRGAAVMVQAQNPEPRFHVVSSLRANHPTVA